MEAIDYFNKYRVLLYEFPGGLPVKTAIGKEVTVPPNEEYMRVITNDILQSFFHEFAEEWKKRDILYPPELKELIDEINEKWNQMVKLFELAYGEPAFVKDGFWLMLLQTSPFFRPRQEENEPEAETPADTEESEEQSVAVAPDEKGE